MDRKSFAEELLDLLGSYDIPGDRAREMVGEILAYARLCLRYDCTLLPERERNLVARAFDLYRDPYKIGPRTWEGRE